MWRIYSRKYHAANWNAFRHYGPTTSRFDHQLSTPDPCRGILYAADSYATCIAEVFQEERFIGP